MPKHKSKSKYRSRSRSRSPRTRHGEKRRKYEESSEKHRHDDDNLNRGRPSESRGNERQDDRKVTPKKKLEDFDIKDYKIYFDRMFFRDYDIVKKNTPVYQEFWTFYDRVQRIRKQRQKRVASLADRNVGGCEEVELGHGVKIPAVFSKFLTVPIALKYSDPEDYIFKLNPGIFRLNTMIR